MPKHTDLDELVVSEEAVAPRSPRPPLCDEQNEIFRIFISTWGRAVVVVLVMLIGYHPGTPCNCRMIARFVVAVVCIGLYVTVFHVTWFLPRCGDRRTYMFQPVS